MKNISKQVISIFLIVVVALLGIGYSISGAKREMSNKESDISYQSGNSNPGNNNTGNSTTGSTWGTNPFTTGNTNTGEVTKPSKPEFKKPNTTWKTKTLSGITYVFGEGNPKEVMPKLEDYAPGWDGYFQEDIVRPKTERLLVEFLSNPMLVRVINQCGPLTKPRIGMTTGLEMNLPRALFTTDFSLNGMLIIDPVTGRKDLDRYKFGIFYVVFSQIREHGYADIHTRVNLLANQCLSENEIVKMDQLYDQYSLIERSLSNSSLENRKEVCSFMKQDNCKYQE